MSKKQKIVAVLSVFIFVTLVCCTFASIHIYRELLPVVELTAPKAGEVYLSVYAEGSIVEKDSRRLVLCHVDPESAAQIVPGQKAQVTAEGYADGIVVVGAVDSERRQVELNVPASLRGLDTGAVVDIEIRIDGGYFDCVLPATSVHDGEFGPYCYIAEEVEGLVGPELLLKRYMLGPVLFTNGEYTAIKITAGNKLPKEIVSFCSEVPEDGMAAKLYGEEQ